MRKQDFPLLSQSSLIYFDSAATTQKPASVIEAMNTFYTRDCGTVHRAIYQLAAHATDQYNSVRQKVAAFLGAKDPSEIIFTRGTTASLNLVASSYGRLLTPGDEIILSEMEHHSNIVPWQLLAEQKGIILKYIQVTDSCELDLAHYQSLLSPRTKLVSIAHIANSTGTLNPIREIITLAHKQGVKVVIDGAQAAGHLPVNVQELDADFYVFSGHKVFGPTGIGILYGKRALLDEMPPIEGGGDMIETVTLTGSTFQPPPLRFEAGTPMIAEVIGLGAALDYIESIGRATIAAYEQQLLAYATEKLRPFPIRIIGEAPQKGPIINFLPSGIHPLDLATLLDLERIALRTGHHCAQPLLRRFGLTSTCRISFSIYNTIEEIDRFCLSLERALTVLK